MLNQKSIMVLLVLIFMVLLSVDIVFSTPITINWDNGNTQTITLGGNAEFSFSNGKSGATYKLILKQDGSGSRTATWPSTVKWFDGIPTLSTGINAIDVVTFIYNGTDYLGNFYKTFHSGSATYGGSGWVDDSTVVRLSTSTDNVGIGTTSPTARLYIKTTDTTTVPFQIETAVEPIWLTDWNYRKPITISNYGYSTALTDYQLLLTINTAELFSAGKMQSGCQDIRFTSSDGTTLQSYWIESGANSSSTKIWVKVTTIPVGVSTIYMFYGNPTASSASDGDATFLLFDHFLGTSLNTGKWTPWTAYAGVGSNSVSGSIITLSTGTTGFLSNDTRYGIYSARLATPVNSAFRMLFKSSTGEGTDKYTGFGMEDEAPNNGTGAGIEWLGGYGTGGGGLINVDAGGSNTVTPWEPATNTWIIADILSYPDADEKTELITDGTSRLTNTSRAPDAENNNLRAFMYATARHNILSNIEVDWVLLRKYAGTATPNASIGSEELPSPPQQTVFYIQNSSANVGVGTTIPAYKLDIYGETRSTTAFKVGTGVGNYLGTDNAFRSTAASSYLNILGGLGGARISLGDRIIGIATGDGSEKIKIDASGNVGIGISTPATKLQVVGDIRVGSSGTNGCVQRFDGTALTGSCSSDERLKENINPIENALNRISKLKPVTYNMKGKNTKAYGLIAQDVEKILSDFVGTDDRGYKTVDYGVGLDMLTIKAIQELKTENDLLKSQNEELEKRIKNIESKIK